MDLFQQLRAFHFCFILKGMEHLNTYKREKQSVAQKFIYKYTNSWQSITTCVHTLMLHACTHAWAHTHMHTQACTGMHVCTHKCTHAHTHTHTCMYAHTHTHKQTYTQRHTHTHTHTLSKRTRQRRVMRCWDMFCNRAASTLCVCWDL